MIYKSKNHERTLIILLIGLTILAAVFGFLIGIAVSMYLK